MLSAVSDTARRPVFYGWYMVGAAVGLQFLQAGLVSQAFGARRLDECHRWLIHGIAMSLVLTIPVMALLFGIGAGVGVMVDFAISLLFVPALLVHREPDHRHLQHLGAGDRVQLLEGDLALEPLLDALRRIVYWFIALGVLGFILNVTSGLRYTRVSAEILFDMRLSLYAHLQRLSPRFYASTRIGDIISRINNDIGEIQRVAAETALAWFGNVRDLLSGPWELVAIILALGPVSGAHLNPVVTLVDRTLGGLSTREAAGYVGAITFETVTAQESPKPSLIAPACDEAKLKSCEKWIACPYSWRITSPSSASSTPPLPNLSMSFLSHEKELSAPHWLMRMSCDSMFTGRSVEPKPSDWMYFCAAVTQ